MNRPATPGNRPSIQPGQRPEIGGGNRPNLPGAGNRPGQPGGGRPEIGGGNRPGFPGAGNRPGQPGGGNRPEIGGGGDRPNFPGAGNRPGQGIGQRPDRPTTLPGLGGGNRPGMGGGNRPNIGIGGGGNNINIGNRPNFGGGNNIIGGGNNVVIGNRPGRPGVDGGFRPNYGGAWGGGHYHPGWHPHPYPNPGHWGWYHGYGPAWGGGRWNYMWNRYPVAAAFGVTAWGLTAASWMFGVGSYYNPYYDTPVIVNNQPVVVYSQPIVGDAADYATADAGGGAPPDPAMDLFDQARSAFYQGQYDQALQLTDQALQKSPRDAAINEFRSLCLFALGRYREAAATIHAVLAVGPGWDWTTLSSLYPSTGAYAEQLRRLEDSIKQKDSADARFLLAYHYLTCDHKEAAIAQLKSVIKLQPKDEVAAQLLQMYAPGETGSSEPPPAPEKDIPPAFPPEKLQGTWTAKDGDGQFTLVLSGDGKFTWTFTREGAPQTMEGTWSLQGNDLAMEPTAGGLMLSEVKLADDSTLDFAPLGQTTKLTFKK